MGDPTPKDQIGIARTLRDILTRLRRLEKATPLQTAFNDASAAQFTADDAQTKAVTAQSTADTAQSTAQTANTAAQQASTDAASASSAATSASQQAQQAQQAVASKTKTTWSTAAPDNTQNPGTADGDTWYVTNGTGGAATAQYRWSAQSAAWSLTPIDGAALRNVIADSIKAGAIDGQTITGATIKTAASGQRVELLNTRMDVYSQTGTTPAGYIFGEDRSQFSAISIVNNYVSSNPGGVYVTVPRNPGATDLANRSVNFEASHGVRSPYLEIGVLSSSYNRGESVPIIDARSQAARFLGSHFRVRPTLGATWPDTDVLAADTSGPVVTASDYRLMDGTSITADTGWTNLNSTTWGTGYQSDSSSTMQVRRIGNRVYVRGQVNRTATSNSGNIANGEVLFVLPANFRPGRIMRTFLAGGASSIIRVSVSAGGNVTVIGDPGPSPSTYGYLDGLTFLTD